MPVQVSEIPGLQATAINAPEASARAAGATGEALGNLAQTIAGVSEHFAGQAQQIQKVENARQISETRNANEEAYAKFQGDNQKESDPNKRMANTMAFLQTQKANMDKPEFSPTVRENLAAHYDEFASHARIASVEDAANLTVKRAGLALSNEITSAEDTLDGGKHKQALDTAQAAGLLLPEQRTAQEARFTKLVEERKTQDTILHDPDGWLNENAKPKPDQPIAEWEKNRRLAESTYRDESAQTNDQIQDAIVQGKITTPEEIDKFAGNLRPYARELLKNTLIKRADATEQAHLKDPEYQNQILGKAAGLLSSYNPEADGVDKQYIQIDSLLRSLPVSAATTELTRQLKAVRTGAKLEIKDHKDAANAALDDHFKELRKKQDATYGGSTMSTARAINDGFLRNASKLITLGYSEDQANSIIGTKDMKDSDREKLFRTLAVSRTGTGSASPFNQAISEAILNGKSEVKYISPEQEDAQIQKRMEIDTQHGKTNAKLADFLKTTPDATSQQIDDKILEYAGEDARKKLSGGFFDPKPQSTAPKGADPSTSYIPQGKDLISVVKHFEAGGEAGGFHKQAYWDYGQWSIGYGTKAKEGQTVTKAEAATALNKELSSHRSRVDDAAKRGGYNFTDHQLDALTSFDFNTGKIGSLLIENGKRSHSEIADKLLLYRNAGGERLSGLERRRAAEREIFLHGFPS